MERYVAAVPADGVLDAVAGDGEVARTSEARGVPTRHVRTIYVPADETCFSLFEAPSEDAVRDANVRLGLPFTRITEAIDVTRPMRRGDGVIGRGQWP